MPLAHAPSRLFAFLDPPTIVFAVCTDRVDHGLPIDQPIAQWLTIEAIYRLRG
jgi:hypothetical protein